MIHTSFVSALVLLAGLSLSAAECSKEKAKKEVQRVCKLIAEKGDVPETADLVFDNCGSNYVWIQDTDANISMISHPIKRRLNKQPLKDRTDENGKRLFYEFDIEAQKVAGKTSTAAAGAISGPHSQGWVEYLWTKPGAEKATPKISYVELCSNAKGVNWVAGSGIWTEDLK